MQVKVLFFGPAKDVTGISNRWFPIEEEMTLQTLIKRLYQEFPEAKEVFELCSFVVNQEFASPDTLLHDRDEIAVLPPVSGG